MFVCGLLIWCLLAFDIEKTVKCLLPCEINKILQFYSHFLYFLAALLIVAFCYGVSVLKIKTNFHEGRWITAAAISMLPIYGVWMLICYCAPAHFHDPTTSVAIIILALMILFIVFIPKMYTIN